jgi:Zn-dependent protease
MSYRDKPWDNPINWSFHIGRLFGIDLRVHITFVICAIVLVAMQMPDAKSVVRDPFLYLLFSALGMYAVLFLIVLLHEFGHCFGARYCGGEADEILIWPLGGLATTNPPHDAAAHMITTVAGPIVNIVICAVCSVALVVWTGRLGAIPWNPLHPTMPFDVTYLPTLGQAWLMIVFGISYLLLLFNLLPIFPFDGGRMVQAWLWPRVGYGRSMLIATTTGMIGAIVLALFALFIEESWLLLVIAFFGYVTCWQQRHLAKEQAEFSSGEFGYDFSRGYSSFEHDEPRPRKSGPLKRWRARRAAAREERERQRRHEHQKAVEAILKKISESGLASLTPRERRILEEETKRQQSI